MKTHFDQMDRLIVSANALSMATDQLHDSIEAVQTKLTNIGVGVEVWLENDKMTGNMVLGYGRLKQSGWQILVKMEGKTWKPLLNCSRQIRVDAVRLLPKLIDALANKAQELTGEMTKGAKVLEEALRLMDE